ncbi:MAG: sensor domain-containing diguanylate cyclase [Pseudomonadota bacterium]
MAASDMLTADELRACLDLGKALTSQLEPPRLLPALLERVSALLPADNWSLLLLDEASGQLRFAVTVGLDLELVKDLRLEPGQGIAGQAVLQRRALVVDDVAACQHFFPEVDQLAGFSTRSIMCAPLIFAGRPLGAIEVINPRRMDAPVLEVLAIVADFVAIAAENARRFQRIHDLSIHDDLTGLFNTRHLYQSLADLIAQGEPFALVFMDIDDFKHVVDTHGHLLGSQVLQEVAQTIRACLPQAAYGVSYGGDEFVVVLPGAGKEQALDRARQIKQGLQDAIYLAGQGLAVRLAASLGVAAYPQDAQDLKGLLALADQAMFNIKRHGKNAVGPSASAPINGSSGPVAGT